MALFQSKTKKNILSKKTQKSKKCTDIMNEKNTITEKKSENDYVNNFFDENKKEKNNEFISQSKYESEQNIVKKNTEDKKEDSEFKVSISNKKIKVNRTMTKNAIESIHKLVESDPLRYFRDGFRSEKYYWEIIILIKKFFLTFISSVKDYLAYETQYLLYFSILFVYLSFLYQSHPYRDKYLNRIEKYSIFGTIFVTLMHILISQISNQEGKIFLSFLVVMSIIAFMIYMVYTFYLLITPEMKKKIKSAISRIFTSVNSSKTKVVKIVEKQKN